MTDSHEDFVSFEKALRDLQMRSEELKKLVSEGEIRAFRDGDSMKFRREDIDGLSGDGDELEFEETLEDDAGMVTEEFSDEDTLLAEDDLDEEDVEDAAPVARSGRRSSGGGRSRAAADEEEEEKAPAWVTAVAVLSAVVMLWGLLIAMSIGAEQSPQDSFATSLFAEK